MIIDLNMVEDLSRETLLEAKTKILNEMGYRDNQRMLKEEAKALVKTFYRTMSKLSDTWGQIDDPDFLGSDYPFSDSFDELTEMVYDWSMTVNKDC